MDTNSILHRVNIDYFQIPAVAVQDLKMIALCRSPYYKHPHGCPNWAYKEGCPPHTKPFLSIYEPAVFVAIARLDFGTYLKLKAERHPTWTVRALKNPRHWQQHLRAAHNRYFTLEKIPQGYERVKNAEAMGVNLFETCARGGFILERNPTHFVCEVSVLARPNHP